MLLPLYGTPVAYATDRRLRLLVPPSAIILSAPTSYLD